MKKFENQLRINRVTAMHSAAMSLVSPFFGTQLSSI